MVLIFFGSFFFSAVQLRCYDFCGCRCFGGWRDYGCDFHRRHRGICVCNQEVSRSSQCWGKRKVQANGKINAEKKKKKIECSCLNKKYHGRGCLVLSTPKREQNANVGQIDRPIAIQVCLIATKVPQRCAITPIAGQKHNV